MKTKVIVNEKVFEGLTALKDFKLSVGWFEDTKYSDGASVAMVAEGNEFGRMIKVTPKMRGWFAVHGVHLKKSTQYIIIQPRPFMRPAIDKNQDTWADDFRKDLLKSILTGGDIEKVLDRLGLEVKGHIQECITEVESPKLSGFTVAMREQHGSGGEKPLVDSGIMLGTISYKAETK